MSQVSKSVSSTPSVPTNFVTDSGTATPVANALNVLADDTTSDNTNGIQTTGSGDTLTVEITNRLYGTGSTTGAVTDDVITFSLGGSTAGYALWFEVIGRDTGTGDLVRYTLRGTFKTDGATATRVNTPFTDDDESASIVDSSADLIASGNNAVVRVTGTAGQTISWTSVGWYLKV